MAKVRVGVKRVNPNTGEEVATIGEEGIEVQQHWVEINGLRLDAEEIGLMTAGYTLGSTNVGEITIKLSCRGFETVDHREELPRGVHVGGSRMAVTQIPDNQPVAGWPSGLRDDRPEDD